MSSPAQILANQQNAQLSTGPTSETGKAKSCLNAVRTGLTGRTVLLPEDDAALYQAHVASFLQSHAPVGDQELRLVQSLADTEWRLLRIPALEMGIFAVGRIELAAQFANEDPEIRRHLIEAKIMIEYHRDLKNLGLQENRLRRQREKDMAALKQLQEERKRERNKALDDAAYDYIGAVLDGRSEARPVNNGFEFSLGEIEVRAMALKPDLFADYELALHKEREARRKNSKTAA